MTAPAQPPGKLIEGCTTGDDSARAQFYNEYMDIVRRSVLRTLHRYGATEATAGETEDLASEVFAKLLANDCALLDSVRESRSIRAWLIAIARNHVIDELRRASVRNRSAATLVREEAPAYAPPQRDAAISNELIHAVRSAVAGLDPPDRLALELYFLQGLTYAQMANILHENVNTVSARVRRAKNKLRRILEAYGIHEP